MHQRVLQHYPFKRRRRNITASVRHASTWHTKNKVFHGWSATEGAHATMYHTCLCSSVSGRRGLFFKEHGWTKCIWWGLTLGRCTPAHSLASTKTWLTHLAEKINAWIQIMFGNILVEAENREPPKNYFWLQHPYDPETSHPQPSPPPTLSTSPPPPTLGSLSLHCTDEGDWKRQLHACVSQCRCSTTERHSVQLTLAIHKTHVYAFMHTHTHTHTHACMHTRDGQNYSFPGTSSFSSVHYNDSFIWFGRFDSFVTSDYVLKK